MHVLGRVGLQNTSLFSQPWVVRKVFSGMADAYVDHLGKETHLANFTYLGHQLCLWTVFFLPYASFPLLSLSRHVMCLLLIISFQSGILQVHLCWVYRSILGCRQLVPTLSARPQNACFDFVCQAKTGYGMSPGLENLFEQIQGLSAGRETVIFLQKWIKCRIAQALGSHRNWRKDRTVCLTCKFIA